MTRQAANIAGALLLLLLVGGSWLAAGSASPPTSLALGQPSVVQFRGLAAVVVLTTNTGSSVQSAVLRATLDRAGATVATADGIVRAVRPGERRVASVPLAGPAPTYDAVRVEVVRVLDDPAAAPYAEAAMKISLSPPTITQTGDGFLFADVAATNGDTEPRSLAVQVAYLRDGRVIGVGLGAVDELGPGETRTVGVLVNGTAEAADEALATVEAVVSGETS